jgi:hypothetical protein
MNAINRYTVMFTRYSVAESARTLGVAISVILMTTVSTSSIYADNTNPGLFSANSTPYGKSTLDWTMEWWKWLIGTPAERNPMKDQTGINCGENQNDTNVWFITGNEGGDTKRSCTIPYGKAIFFGHGYECSTYEYPHLDTFQELHDCAIDSKNALIKWKYRASLDGVELKNLTSYEEISPEFEIYYPPKAIWVPPETTGVSRAAADTYFIFFEPLSEGQHVFDVESTGDILDPNTGEKQHQAMHVTYELTIKR